MPTNREKSRKRTTSSELSGTSSVYSPQSHALQGDTTTSSSVGMGTELDTDFDGLRLEYDGTVTLPCCSPRGCMLGPISSSPKDTSFVRMQCSSEKCPYSSYMHGECFDLFEEQVLSCLRGMSRAKNWSEKQRKQNLWTKKGYDLIFRFCTCRCTKGTLKKDINNVLTNSHLSPIPSSASVPITSSKPQSSLSVSISISGAVGGKKRRKKSASYSEKSSVVSQIPISRPRARSHKNSDSLSSDNGASYMQPFAHRTDYSVFDQILPRSMVNPYNIKMEDDGYAAGDETRSLVLSCLAFHHKSHITCVMCETKMEVYDRFPLINGTFYLSPLQSRPSSLEVETKGDDPLYMSAVCVYCLTGLNKVYCSLCNSLWNGKCHQIGTLYTYDIFASNPCCTGAVECKGCGQPLINLRDHSLSFTQLSSLYGCNQCGTNDYHFIRPLTRFSISIRPGTASGANTPLVSELNPS